jgi:transcriptional regulator with XRE-family HTH domain
MGRGPRKRPKRLAEKLRWIREELALSQTELIDRIQIPGYPLHKGDISNFELDKSEPQLAILLRYARLVGISVDVLIDDELEVTKIGVGKPANF